MLKTLAFTTILCALWVPVRAESPSTRESQVALELVFLRWTPASGTLSLKGFERTADGFSCREVQLSLADEQNLVDSLPSGGQIELLSSRRFESQLPSRDTSDLRRAIVVLQHQIESETALPIPAAGTVLYVQSQNDAWLVDPNIAMDRKLILRPSRDKRRLLYDIDLEGVGRQNGVAWQADR